MISREQICMLLQFNLILKLNSYSTLRDGGSRFGWVHIVQDKGRTHHRIGANDIHINKVTPALCTRFDAFKI